MQVFHITGAAPLCTNTFLLVGNAGHAAVVDPAADAKEYEKLLQEHGAVLTHIFLTHGHHDHVGAVQELQQKYDATVYLGTQDHKGTQLFPLKQADKAYEDGMRISVDELEFTVITTPGHSAGSVCLLCGDLLFAGDTLFAGDIGRCDLVDGSYPTMLESLHKLADLVPSETQVLPGHGPFSTMADELAHNSYLQF